MAATRNGRSLASTLVLALLALSLAPGAATATGRKNSGRTRALTIVHLADTHGKLQPHWEHLGGKWQANAAGLARDFTLVQRVRRATRGRNLFLMNGDNFASGAEVFFTRGRAVVPIFNQWGIDAYTPGNWDFTDGPDELRARFAGAGSEPPLVTFPVLAAGVYNAPGAPADAKLGARVFRPYMFKRVNGLNVAIIGLNDDKPTDMQDVFTVGLELRSPMYELPRLVREVRSKRPDLVVVMSEAGLAQNVALARDVPGVDVILSADTHEETSKAIVVKRAGSVAEAGERVHVAGRTGTIVVESGEGNHVGQLDLQVAGHGKTARVAGFGWNLRPVLSSIPEDPQVKALVDQARAPFLSGPAFTTHVRTYAGWKPGTGLTLTQPLDTVLGKTDVDLERHNVNPGPGDAVIAEALRDATGADISGTNGFRFDVGIPAGQNITLGDVFNWVPLGAHVAVGEMTGGQILDRFERFVSAVLDPNPYRRGGGWLERLSGIRFFLDLRRPFGPTDDRIVRAEIIDKATGQWQPLVEDRVYTIASCYGPGDPLDHMCRTDGVRNLRFLTEDGQLAPPLVDHEPPNPQRKLKVAPDNVMSLPELVRRYIVAHGGVHKADYTPATWIVLRGRMPRSRLLPGAIQPLSGSGGDWLAGKRVEREHG